MHAKGSFLKYRYFFLGFSFLFILLAFFVTLFTSGGFNWGIDFSSGYSARFRLLQELEYSQLEENLKDNIFVDQTFRLQLLSDDLGQGFLLRFQDIPFVSQAESSSTIDLGAKSAQGVLVQNFLQERLSTLYPGIVLDNFSFIAPDFSETLTWRTLLLVFFTLLVILLYIWFRFELAYSISALVALIHDVIFVLAFLGLFQIEFSIPVVVSLLTIVGYSLNDTIVIFDRIRENLVHGFKERETLEHLIDRSLWASLSRTLITSLTTFLAVFCIYLFAEGNIRDFALSFLIGIIIGTFSSLYVAPSTLLFWKEGLSALGTKKDSLGSESVLP